MEQDLHSPHTHAAKAHHDSDTPSEKHLVDAIYHAIIGRKLSTARFTRKGDQWVVDYLYEQWFIAPTEGKFSYNQDFEIIGNSGKSFIKKYQSSLKTFDVMLSENPMIGTLIISFAAIVMGGVTVRSIIELIKKAFHIVH